MTETEDARFRPEGQDDLAPSGSLARVRANLEAIRLVRALDEEKRPATRAEQQVLARWSGWGAVPAVFDERETVDGRPGPGVRYEWTREELRRLLSPDEYESARANTVNAHFTDAGLVTAIWDGLGELGFAGGRVLEPGCGSGNFIGMAPPGTDMVGVELDPTTAAIASALYPHATIHSESFAATRLPEGSFDAVIGNVPFGSIQLRDLRYNPGRRLSIHTHFVLKSLHLVAPGGMVALITSRFTMDGTTDAAVRARERMAAMADLVTAVRLPDTAHRRAAGTSVVTDLLILRRREPDRAPDGVAWVNAPVRQVDGEDIAINEYFDAHPEMVLGTLAASGRREGELKVVGAADAAPDLVRALACAAAQARERNLLMAPSPAADPATEHPPAVPAETGGRPEWVEGYIAANDDGTFTQIQDGFIEPYEPPRMSAAEGEELRALCGLRDTTLALLEVEARNDEPEMDRLRAQLNDRYDRYLERYGPVNRVSLHPRIRDTPEGQALRDRLLADGHARIAGGTFTLTGDPAEAAALRAHLLNEGLAVEAPNGELRMRQSRAARAERDRLVAAGRAEVHGGTFKMTDEGQTIALDAGPAAVSVTRRRPRQGGFRSDPFAVRVQGLERYSAPTQTATKTDIFRQPVMPARSAPRSADTPADALAICMDQHAQVRLDVIAGLLGVEEQTARERLGDLVFHDPEQDRLVPAAEYLSGDVRAKLELATAAAIDDPALRVNVDALTKVIPEDLGPAEIEVRLGSVIVDADHVQQFLRETLQDDTIRVSLRADGEWKVHGGPRGGVLSTSTWGTEQAPAVFLAEHLLNQRAIKVHKKVDKATVLDEEATEAAQSKAEELNERFGEWIWEDLDRAEKIARRYNDTFNSIVLRSYDDVELSLPGLNRNIRLHWWQKAAVARMIAEPAVGLFHDMGAGKTLEQIIGMMELRRLGLINKPVMCVKNHMLEQVRDEFMWAYPSARVLCADSDELAGEGKRRFIARCMSENPDAVILTRGAFAGINLSPEGHRAYIDYAVDLFSAHQDDDISVKDQQTSMMNFRQKIEAIIKGDPGDEDDLAAKEQSSKKRRRPGIDKDPALTWEHAGFDYIVVDESQDFNNLWTPSNVEGMDIGFVHRAIDLEMKLHSTRQRFGERVVTFATGTPVTNRIVQFYVMQRYLRPDRLKAAGFHSADSWLATFAEQETRLELKGDNTYGPVNRTSKLINVPELLLDIHQFGDFKTADDIELERPAITGGKPEVRVIPASPELTDFQQALSHRYADARKNRGRKGEDTVVAVIGDGFRAGQDLRLVNPRHGPLPEMTDEPQKVDALAADLLDEWRKHRDDVYLDADGNPDPVRGSLFLVFSNEGVPSPDWNLYDELRELLVKGGMPRKMIRFIHETGSDRRKKSELMTACNDGHVAVLIGSTEKMGVGTNFQRRVAGIYKMHPHWRPDYDQQEDARGRRPGNQNSEIFIRKFITEGSYDVIRAQRCEMKASFLSTLKRRDPTVRSIEVPDDDTLSYAEVAALGAGDLRLVEKASLEAELKKLVRAQRSHAREQTGLKMTMRQAEQSIRQAENAIHSIDEALPRRVPTAGDRFAMTIEGTRHTKRADAATHLRTVLLKLWDGTAPDVPKTADIGELGGFTIHADLRRERRPDTVLLNLRGVYDSDVLLPHNKIPAGHGLIIRLENRLADLEHRREVLAARIPVLRQEIEHAAGRIGRPFPDAERLTQTRARISELERALTDGRPPEPGPDTDQNLVEDLVDRAVTGILAEQEQPSREEPTPEMVEAEENGHLEQTPPADPLPASAEEASGASSQERPSPAPAGGVPAPEPTQPDTATPEPTDPPSPPGMTPERRAELIEAMTLLAPAMFYAGAGDPARYAVEGIDNTLAPGDSPVTREEWDWAEGWARLHPELADGDRNGITVFQERRRKRIEAIRRARRDDAARISRQAREAWKNGDTDQALLLIGEGERLYPDDPVWDKARNAIHREQVPSEDSADDSPADPTTAETGRDGQPPASEPEPLPDTELQAVPSQADSSTPVPPKSAESAADESPATEDTTAAEPSQNAAAPGPSASESAPTPAHDADAQVGNGGQMPQQPADAELAAGPWATRIRIDDSLTRPTVRGTRFEDIELREVLRDHGFRWRRARELWEYSGPAGAKAAAIQAVRDKVAELDRAESTQDAAAPKRSYPPTAQQQAIIDAAVTQKLDVAVQALAGTGKTSTLNMVAERVAEASPETRIVYIAFNASIAKEARETFGSNVTSVTAHALALRSLRTSPFADKTAQIGKGIRHPGDIADLLNLETVKYLDYDGEPQELVPSVRAQLAMAVVRKFRESADPQITEAHLPDALMAFPGTDSAVLDTARRVWDDIADPSNARLLEGDRPGAILFDHDDYLKLWALSRPRIDADLIFFDEAQDINGVLRQVVQDQPTQTIVVGDTYQSIYGFRGAEDALADWPADVTLPLTQSWRFGPRIAGRGDDFLRLLNAPYELTGNPALDSTIGQITDPDAILCRTNVGAVSEVFRAFDADKRVALVGGGGEISKLARAAKDLKAGRGTKHPELSRFATWADVEEAAREERALQPFVRLIDQHGPDELLRMVDNLSDEGATGAAAPDVVVSTAHRAKGREWDRVRIADDFYRPKYHESGSIESLPPAEELRLSYVAVTRGRQAVDLGSLDWIEDVAPGIATAPALDDRQATETAIQETPPRKPEPVRDPMPEPSPAPAPAAADVPLVPPQAEAPAAEEVISEPVNEQPAPTPSAPVATPRATASHRAEENKRQPTQEPAGQIDLFTEVEPTVPDATDEVTPEPDLPAPEDGPDGPDVPTAPNSSTSADSAPVTESPAATSSAVQEPDGPDNAPPHLSGLDDALTALAEAHFEPFSEPAADDEPSTPPEAESAPPSPAADEQLSPATTSEPPLPPIPDVVERDDTAAASFGDIHAAFESIKRALEDPDTSVDITEAIAAVHGAGIPPQADPQGEERPASPVPPAGVDDALATPLREANTHLGEHAGSQEWQRIAEIVAASRELKRTILGAAGSYRREVANDLRIQGFWRTVTARCARTIATAAYGLAGRIENGASRTVRALRALARHAADYADRLTGTLPAGRTLRSKRDLEQGWTDLDTLLDGPAKPRMGGPTWTGEVLRAGVTAMRQAWDTATGTVGTAITSTRAWQQMSALWDGARSVLDKVHQGALAFERDAYSMGLFAAVWSRTCETLAWGTRQALEHLHAKGTRAGAGWQALRLLHHTAEETIAHLRGRLPRGEHSELGTYDPPALRQAAQTMSATQPATFTPATEPGASPIPPATADRDAVYQELIGVLDAIDYARQQGELTGGFAQVGKLAEQSAARLGLSRIGVPRETFDPTRHYALGVIDGVSAPADVPIVGQVVRSGYMAEGRVVRPAAVMVAQPGQVDTDAAQARRATAASNQLTDNPSGLSSTDKLLVASRAPAVKTFEPSTPEIER